MQKLQIVFNFLPFPQYSTTESDASYFFNLRKRESAFGSQILDITNARKIYLISHHWKNAEFIWIVFSSLFHQHFLPRKKPLKSTFSFSKLFEILAEMICLQFLHSNKSVLKYILIFWLCVEIVHEKTLNSSKKNVFWSEYFIRKICNFSWYC